MKYKLEFHPNPNVVTIHVAKCYLPANQPMYSSSHGGFGKQPKFAKEILSLEGVVSISISDKYQANMHKGSIFDWEDILTPALDIIGLALSPDEQMDRGPDIRYYIDGAGYRIELKEGEEPPKNIVRNRTSFLGPEFT